MKQHKRYKNKSALTVKNVSVGEECKKGGALSSVLLCIISVVTVYCISRMFTESFGFFNDTPAGIYDCRLSSAELFKFWVVAVAGCAVICAANGLKKHPAKITLALFIGSVLFFVYHYKNVANGFVHAINKIIQMIGVVQGLDLNIYYLTSYTPTDPKLELQYFCLTVIWGTCFVVAFAVVRHCNPIILTAFVALYVAPPLSFNVFIGERYVIVAAVCCILVFVMKASGYFGTYTAVRTLRFSGLVRVNGQYSSAAAFQQGIAALLCLTICLTVISAVYDSSKYTRNENVDKLSKNITSIAENIVLGNGFGFANGSSGQLNNGNVSHLSDIEFTGRTMFKVKTSSSVSSAIYLRSYTAANFNGRRWSELSGDTYRKYESMWTSFNEDSFFPQFMYGNMRNILLLDTYKINLEVVNLDINNRVFLTSPNLYPNDSEDLSLAKTSYDNAFKTNSMLGLDSYNQLITSQALSNDDVYLYYGTGDDSLYDILHDGDFYYSDNYEESTEDSISEFNDKEKQYRQFVMENYTSYPESIDSIFPEEIMLDEIFESASVPYYSYSSGIDDSADAFLYNYDSETFAFSSDENSSVYFFPYEDDISKQVVDNYYSDVISLIRNYLEENTEYTLTPGETPTDEDFVDYFINESHKGYCVHYATAATLLLRKAGIPARYVEGYYISSSDLAEADSDGYVTVPDSRAHAWTEVYYPLSGWTVVDFTPSYGQDGVVPEENDYWQNNDTSDAETEVDTDTTADTESDTDTESEIDTEVSTEKTESDKDEAFSTDTSSPSSDSEQDRNEKITEALKCAKYISVIVLVLLAAVVLWRLVRLIVKSFNYKRFTLGNRRKSAAALYRYSLRLLAFVGFAPSRSEGEVEFAERVGSECEFIDSTEITAFAQQALSSKFSKNAPSVKEIKEMASYIEKLSNSIYNASTKKKRFVMKYILFLR